MSFLSAHFSLLELAPRCSLQYLAPPSDQSGAKPSLSTEREQTDPPPPALKDTFRVIDTSRFELDDVDRRILALLSQDSRTPFLSIAADLKVDEKTIRNRVGKLKDAGVIQCGLLVQPNKLEDFIVVHLGIRLKPDAKSQRAQIADGLAQLEGVNWCSAVLGTYDLLLQAIFSSFAAMKCFELETLATFPGLESAESMLTLSHHGAHGIPSRAPQLASSGQPNPSER
ncbi:MAG: Lrp/AsnC family transcriptional regulator [Bdellovibrionota bacterium]